MPETESLALTLPIRRLVEFLLRSGSIDSRFTGFDRANEGARLHRKLQRAAVKEYPDYEAEAALRQEFGCEGITYTLEGRADGLFTDRDGMRTIDEIIHSEREHGHGVVLTTHDLDEARAADWVLLTAGRVLAAGPPAQVLTRANLEAAYGLGSLHEPGEEFLDDPACEDEPFDHDHTRHSHPH